MKEQNKENIWILGGGKAGTHAVRQLQKLSPASSLVVVDPAPPASLPEGIEYVQADGIKWLCENFKRSACVHKIIPALPVHMLALWLAGSFKRHGMSLTSTKIQMSDFPEALHPIRISPSQIALSHADFICPLGCSEPEDICTHTGQPRPTPLYTILETLAYANVTPLILQSRQFAPGVGGFFPEDLWNFQERVEKHPDTPLLVGTACKCHGIVDGFILSSS